MTFADAGSLAMGALFVRRTRSVLSLLGIAIGVGAVVLLTSIGEGTRRYILSEFTQFGTNLLTITPGKTKTVGIPGVLGGTTHKLTLEDAEAIRRLPGLQLVVPLAAGNARVKVEDRGRSVSVFGVTADMPALWKFHVRLGKFLPRDDPRRARQMAVLGPTLKRELFGETNPLGRFIRIGGYRFRVIGVMAPKGHMLGFDVDDAVYVPVASVLKMFNMEELIEVDVAFSYEGELDHVVKNIRKLLTLRHQNTEDFTITTQAAMLKVLDEVMNVVTMAVGAIAAISLFVGAMGILTVMWMAVGERTSEIGLLKATGARDSQIYHVFLMESVILAVIGGGVGILAGLSIVAFLPLFLPDLPVYPHTGYLGMAFLISVVVGICSGIFPAQRAASLDPLDALHID